MYHTSVIDVCIERLYIRLMTLIANRAGRREWVALSVLVLPLLLVSMDITVLYFAVPEIAADLAPTSTQQLWMIDVYGFVLAGMLITMGNLGDIVGRRRLLLAGATLFGIASVMAAFAPTAEVLIAARALQGLGGATLMPSTLALVRNMFHDQQQRRSAIAVWSIGLSAGAAIGPIVSGLLLNNFWWGSIFLINVPVLALLWILTPMLVPEYRRAGAGSFDAVSSLLSLGAILPIIWGIKEAAAASALSVEAVASIVGGLIVGYFFIHRQRHREHPMLDLRMFRERGFGPAILVNLTAFLCLIGYGIFTTQYLLGVLGMTPLAAALWTMASPVLSFVLVPFAVIFTKKIRPAYVMGVAFLFVAAGFAAMTQVTPERNMPLIVAGTVGIGVGAAIVLTMITDLVVAVAPVETVGSVSALNQTFQEFGGALGIAVFGSIGAALYGHNLEQNVTPDIPRSTVEAAEETIGSAVQISHDLPAGAADALLHAARGAFADAMNGVALVGLAVALSAAVFTVSRLRHVASLPDEEQVQASLDS